MSCSGCRVLRKGCSDNCILRHCLQFIDSPQAQAHATVFLAKFFGRAGLMSFISSVPHIQRPHLFQSLLFEAVGRTVNPVSGAVGLLWTGNWQLCQSGVETVLRGGALRPLPEFLSEVSLEVFDDVSESGADHQKDSRSSALTVKRKREGLDDVAKCRPTDLDLSLISGSPYLEKQRRAPTPSEESETTTLGSRTGDCDVKGDERRVLRLFI